MVWLAGHCQTEMSLRCLGVVLIAATATADLDIPHALRTQIDRFDMLVHVYRGKAFGRRRCPRLPRALHFVRPDGFSCLRGG